MTEPLPWDPGFGPLVHTRLRVMTWNVWGRYGPWQERQPVILENLRAVDADVICLQEAWEDDDRSQPQELGGALGLSFVYAPAFVMGGAWSGNAVLSRWPIMHHEVGELPMGAGDARDTDEGERRLAVRVDIDGPRGAIQVFCTHLSWRADWSAVRGAQLAEVSRLVAAARPRTFPAVLCGDLNAAPESDEIRMITGLAPVAVPGVVFRDAWTAAGDGPGWTIDPRNPFIAAALEPPARIDYVLVGWPKLGGVGQVLSTRVAGDIAHDGLYGSDHFGVVAELRY